MASPGRTQTIKDSLIVAALAIAGTLLGSEALGRLARPTSPCPNCSLPVRDGAPACPRCRTALVWRWPKRTPWGLGLLDVALVVAALLALALWLVRL